jgi:sortase A
VPATFVAAPIGADQLSLPGLAAVTLRRPGARRALSVLSVVLFLAGVAMFAYPVGTDAFARYQQNRLSHGFGSTGLRLAYRTHTVPVGQALTRLRIPRIGLNVLVVEGTTAGALRAGAGHYVGSPLPGEVGNVGIAGHRTTFGRPFNHLDELKPGDEAILETQFSRFIYRAVAPFDGHANPWVVTPTDVSVIGQTTGHEMTFTTCNPKGSASQRLVLRLELVSSQPLPPP